jgi:hypothetical protein
MLRKCGEELFRNNTFKEFMFCFLQFVERCANGRVIYRNEKEEAQAQIDFERERLNSVQVCVCVFLN